MNKKAKQDIFVCLVIYAFMLFCFVCNTEQVKGRFRKSRKRIVKFTILSSLYKFCP